MDDFSKKCQIDCNEELGRFATAATDLKAGETILLESPVLILPTADESRCSNCLKLTDSYCNTCNVIPLCPECREHNIFDCKFFADRVKNVDVTQLRKHGGIYGVLKVLLLRQNDDTSKHYEEFIKLEAHMKNRENTEIWLDHQENIVKPLKQSGLLAALGTQNEAASDGASLGDDLLQRWCGIVDVNSFEIRAPDSASMRAVYMKAALLAHNCVANTAIAIDDNYQMKIYANRDIKKDEILTYSYTNVLLGTAERQHLLQVGKYFHCKCSRCEDPSELGSHMSSLLCSPCGANKQEGIILKNKDGQWQCQTCQNTLKTEFVESILERAKEEIFHAKDDIYRYELLLAKLSRILHRNHYLMVDLKQNIAAILRSIILNLAHRPGRKVYERKVRLCQEILAVLQIIQPNFSRLKAIALYELCNSSAELYRLRFGEHEISELELLKYLQQCETMLRESIRLLLYEPIETPEGQLMRSMLKELKDLQNDMSLLQQAKAKNDN